MDRKRILLVDDSQTFQRQMAACLAELPTAQLVGQAHSGREAVDISGRVEIDLVLMDLAMPEMNGLEATRLIKARGRAPTIWVVTFQDDAESRDAAISAGADEFVPKPQLLTRLLAFLEGDGPGAP